MALVEPFFEGVEIIQYRDLDLTIPPACKDMHGLRGDLSAQTYGPVECRCQVLMLNHEGTPRRLLQIVCLGYRS